MKIYGYHISILQSIWIFLEIAIKTARFILAKQKKDTHAVTIKKNYTYKYFETMLMQHV